jgi:hypothetical protein
MNCYPMAALERTMKIQEVILRALAKKISWWQAAEIIGFNAERRGRNAAVEPASPNQVISPQDLEL